MLAITYSSYREKNQQAESHCIGFAPKQVMKMRDKIKLVSTAGTGYFYTTTKNKRTMPEKMEIKKFDPKIRQHVMFKETKIK